MERKHRMVEQKSRGTTTNLKEEYSRHIKPQVGKAPWLLRVAIHKGKPSPVLLVKERLFLNGELKDGGLGLGKTMIKDRGLIYGQPLRRCLPIIRTIVNRICDHAEIPLELQRYLPSDRISFRGNLPLDDEAGAKLSLIFKLQQRVRDMDRVELMARRIDRFSREEAIYWFSRVTQYGPAASRWAQAGMRILLGGQPGDKAILDHLEQLRR